MIRSLRVLSAPRRLTSVVSILAASALLLSFAASVQPVLADTPPYPPTAKPNHPHVNGLSWGDPDNELCQPIASGTASNSVLYRYVDAASGR